MPTVRLTRDAIEAPAIAALPARLWRLYVSLRILADANGRVFQRGVAGALAGDPGGPAVLHDVVALRRARLLEMLPDNSVRLFLRQAKARAAKEHTGPVVALIPVQGGGQWQVRESFVAELRTAFPGVDIENQIRRAVIYFESVPAKRKTARGMARCLYTWMRRESAAQPAPARAAYPNL
jgi:hypothetical protein